MTLKIAQAQLNPTVGDTLGNLALLKQAAEDAHQAGADLLVTPEMFMSGYPPEDLLYDTEYLQSLHEVDMNFPLPVIVGMPWLVDDRLYNAAVLWIDGKAEQVHAKEKLPNYAVFDEYRYFTPGDAQTNPVPFSLPNHPQWRIGLSVCEDIWHPDGPHHRLASEGANLLINLSASPFHQGKGLQREKMLATRASDSMAWVVYTNMVGGQDELVFDGHSLVVHPTGQIWQRGPQFESGILYCDLDLHPVQSGRLQDARWRGRPHLAQNLLDIVPGHGHDVAHQPEVLDLISPLEELARATEMGIRDYVSKNGFGKIILGLSGGIDSALVVALAVRALGPENVMAVSMPSQYNSEGTKNDARDLAEGLGIRFQEMPISDILSGYPEFGGVARENLQARIRGNILMAISNEEGYLLLTTGNKSELSLGYATLYGDTAGGFAPLKDMYKTQVFALTRYLFEQGMPIPETIITRPPSAELSEDQKDSDSLPEYDVLDPVLQDYIEEGVGIKALKVKYPDYDWIDDIARRLRLAEYKRRQYPPGVRLSVRAYGKDWRQPITRR